MKSDKFVQHKEAKMNKEDALRLLASQCKCSDDSGSCTACQNYYDLLAEATPKKASETILDELQELINEQGRLLREHKGLFAATRQHLSVAPKSKEEHRKEQEDFETEMRKLHSTKGD